MLIGTGIALAQDENSATRPAPYEKRILELTIRIAADPTDTAALHKRAAFYKADRKNQQALADLDALIEYDGTRIDLLFERGRLRLDTKGCTEQAIEDFSEILRLEPENADAYRYRGYGYKGLQKDDEALDDFTRAVQVDPYNERAYRARGDYYLNHNQPGEARDDYSRLVQLDPSNSYYFYLRAYAALTAGDTLDAIPDYRKAAAMGDEGAQRRLEELGK